MERKGGVALVVDSFQQFTEGVLARDEKFPEEFPEKRAGLKPGLRRRDACHVIYGDGVILLLTHAAHPSAYLYFCFVDISDQGMSGLLLICPL